MKCGMMNDECPEALTFQFIIHHSAFIIFFYVLLN